MMFDMTSTKCQIVKRSVKSWDNWVLLHWNIRHPISLSGNTGRNWLRSFVPIFTFSTLSFIDRRCIKPNTDPCNPAVVSLIPSFFWLAAAICLHIRAIHPNILVLTLETLADSFIDHRWSSSLGSPSVMPATIFAVVSFNNLLPIH